MLPDRVSNPGPLTYESGALPIALCGPATCRRKASSPFSFSFLLKLRSTLRGKNLLILEQILSCRSRPLLERLLLFYGSKKAMKGR